jgi:cytoplasmic iron level regulating protein YaaA (DUF328/UPF0246 family)
MKTVVLISCVSQKLSNRAKAKELYISTLFKKNMEYAKSLKPENIFILSAKYGLVKLEEEIDTYDETLNTKGSKEIKLWADKVIKSLSKEIDLDMDRVIFLAGEKYRKYLLPSIKNYEIPMEGLGIGEQLKFLTEIIRN